MARNALMLLLVLAMTAAWQPLGLSAAAGEAIGLPAVPGNGEAANVAAPASVVAKVQGFRPIEAAIDPRTDGRQLRLRLERPGITLWRSAAWDEVQWVKIGDHELSGPQFKQLVDRFRAEHPPLAVPDDHGEPNKTIVIRGERQPYDGQQESARHATPPDRPAQHRPPGQVRYLKLDAALANWDADPEPDGLLIRIEPANDSGDTVPVAGLLEVELLARQTGISPPPQPFVRIGYWSQQVRAADFGPGGAVYRMPFQGVHPEFDRQYSPHAAVLARLSVPSMGVFAASADTVRVRGFSPVRDKLQQLTGQRFFAEEPTGEGRR